MKTSTKILLALAAILIIAGLVCLIGVLASNNWKLSSLGSEPKTFEIEVTDPFEGIMAETNTEDVSFLPSEDGKCRVAFTVDEKTTASAEVNGGVLMIKAVDQSKWFDFSLFSFGSRSVTVYLPEKEFGSLNIINDTGDVVIPKEFGFERINIVSDTGDVDCFASVTENIQIETDTGHIKMQGVTANDMSLRVSTGRVELTGVDCAGALEIKVSTGRTIMQDVTCGSLTSDGDTGDMDLTNVIVSGALSIERSTGDIKFDRCDAAELNIETDTGDVTGSLLTEKVFIVQSDTGRISVPESVTGGKCKITTDTGDIKLTVG